MAGPGVLHAGNVAGCIGQSALQMVMGLTHSAHTIGSMQQRPDLAEDHGSLAEIGQKAKGLRVQLLQASRCPTSTLPVILARTRVPASGRLLLASAVFLLDKLPNPDTASGSPGVESLSTGRGAAQTLGCCPCLQGQHLHA